MKTLAKILIIAILFFNTSSATYAQSGFVCGATADLGYLICYRIDAVYNSWIVRRGQTIYITIPSSDVVPASRGLMILYVSGACLDDKSSRPSAPVYFVRTGNTSQWTYTVPSGAVADPCTVSLGVSLHKCVGVGCEPLPQWLENPTNQVSFGFDLGSALVNIFRIEIFRWFIAIFVGGLAGSILLRRIIEAVTRGTDTETDDYQKKKTKQVAEEEQERGEWKDDKTA